MRYDVVTIFPELIEAFASEGLLAKALQAGTVALRARTPREFKSDRHRTVDDEPYGGGGGMVMQPGPLCDAMEAFDADAAAEGNAKAHRLLLTPQGKPLVQADVRRWAAMPALMLVCGRYEGVDERVRAEVDEQVSLGDFVLQGGELGALAIIEATSRLVPGVLGNASSAVQESHSEGLLEYPHYTRPREFRGQAVPEVLLSGNHGAIERWRRLHSLLRTRAQRPDLFAALELSDEDATLLREHDG